MEDLELQLKFVLIIKHTLLLILYLSFLLLLESNIVWLYQNNALVERAHKEINRHIRALTYDNNSLEDCIESLPFIQRILNLGYSDRLKVSAAELLFGKMIDLNAGLFISRKERSEEHSSETISSYIIKLLECKIV